jgi:hypothetical protein
MSTSDVTDYGTDWAGATSAGVVYGLSSGPQNVANALARRFQTTAGALAPYHPSYGLDLRMWVGRAMSPADVSALQLAVKSQAEDDVRVDHAAVVVSLSLASSTLVVALSIELVTGETFDLVLGVSSLTVEILNANGQPATAAVPGPTSTEIVYVTGPQGPAGPPGAGGGGGGGGSGAVTLNDPDPNASSAGTEEVVFQQLVDFGFLGTTPTLELAATGGSTSGTATIRLRVGGNQDTADGTVAASVGVSVVGPLKISASGPLTNPLGLQWVKVTLTSSGAGVDSVVSGLTVTIR